MDPVEDDAWEPPEEPDPLRAGDVVGAKYRIDRAIGRGGMGRVYAATNLLTSRPVALKWLLPKNAEDAKAVSRFLREAKAIGAVEHPNVVNVFDVGHHESSPFLVMELLRGQPLSAIVGHRKIPAAELVTSLMPAFRGIHAAHTKGIVHRDLKPDNLFLCAPEDGRPRTTKVLDFGISKAFDERALELSSVTRSGTIVGTPHYMSPEQISGGGGVDARTDVWALGVILYEGLTGRRPFDAPTFMALVVEIATAPVAAPSTIVPDIDPALEQVVLRALARDPAERFADVASLARALEPYAPGVRFDGGSEPDLAFAPTHAVPTPHRSVPAPPMPRRWTWVAIALPIVIASGALAWWASSSPRIHEEPPAAASERSWRLRERRVTFVPAERRFLAARLSADGRFVAYSDRDGLYVRDVESGEERHYELEEGRAVYDIRWFPDGSRLLTAEQSLARSSLWIVSVLSGARRRVVDLDLQGPGAVSPDGTRIAFVRSPEGDFDRQEIAWMDLADGRTHRVPTAHPIVYNGELQFSPDGTWITYRYNSPREARLDAVRVADGRIRNILRIPVPRALRPHWWIGAGHMLYIEHARSADADDEETLHELRLDPELRVVSDRVVAEWSGLNTMEMNAAADASRILVSRLTSQRDVALSPMPPSAPARLTHDDADEQHPAWRDARTIVFTTTRGGTEDLYEQRIDASDAEPLSTGPDQERTPAVRRDGTIYFLRGRDLDDPARETCSLMRSTDGAVREIADLAAELRSVHAICRTARVKCAADSDVCYRSRLGDDELVLDPVDHPGPVVRVARTDGHMGGAPWALSRDGATVAYIGSGALVLREIASDATRTIPVPIDDWIPLQIAATPDGAFLVLIISPDEWFPTVRLLRVDDDGTTATTFESRRSLADFALAPEGDRIAFTEILDEGDAWLLTRQ